MPGTHTVIQAVLSGLLLGGLFALTATGLSLVLGVMRVVNLLHGAVVVLGSYLGCFLLSGAGIDPLLALPLVFAVAAALSYPVHRVLIAPLTRHGAQAPLLTTFALAVVAENLYLKFFSGDTRSLDRAYTHGAFGVLGITIPEMYLIGFGISLAITVAVSLLIGRTGFGLRLRAGAEDPDAAAMVGVSVERVHGLTFALSGGLAASGGVLVALCYAFTPASGTEYLLAGFAIVVLGGLGNVLGTFAGGVTLGVVQSVGAAFVGDGYRQLIGLLLFLAILAVRPQGLYARTARLRTDRVEGPR